MQRILFAANLGYVADIIHVMNIGAFFGKVYVWTMVILVFQPIIVIFYKK